MPAGIIEQLYEFTARWTLNNDAQDKLAALPRNLQDLALTQFERVDGVVDGADQSEKFITFASGLTTAFGGAAAAAAKRPASWAADNLPVQKAAKWESGPNGTYLNPGSRDATTAARVQQFVERWTLNQDSVDRIHRLSPSALEVVLTEFDASALPPGSDCNGKFISFASKVNNKHMRDSAGDKGWGKGMEVWGGWFPPAAAMWGGPAMWGAPGAAMWGAPAGKGGGKKGGGKAAKPKPAAAAVDTAQLQAFIDTWSLNQDAVNKIQTLSPQALKVVLTQFCPQGECADASGWSGKFILFASKVEREQRSDPMAAFISQWGLNEDAQAKLQRLAGEDPDVLQKVMLDFKPTAVLDDYSGMFIGFATSVFKRMRQMQ